VNYPAGVNLQRVLTDCGFTLVNQRRHFFGMTERIELQKTIDCSRPKTTILLPVTASPTATGLS